MINNDNNGVCCSYCGRVCQRRDWPRHKQRCSAYRVSRDSVAGNHAVAARSDTCVTRVQCHDWSRGVTYWNAGLVTSD